MSGRFQQLRFTEKGPSAGRGPGTIFNFFNIASYNWMNSYGIPLCIKVVQRCEAAIQSTIVLVKRDSERNSSNESKAKRKRKH